MEIAAGFFLGYLLGSIPVGLIVSRFQAGVDVRNFGSGKTGFTNSLRVLGFRRAVPVLAGDLGKGLASVLLVSAATDNQWAAAAAALGAVVGHIWPVFAGFQGGRGILTGAGALLALNPWAALALTPLAALVIVLTRYVSLASISAAAGAGVVFLALALTETHSWANAAAALLGAALVIGAHHDNIGRLLRGEERKIGQPRERR